MKLKLICLLILVAALIPIWQDQIAAQDKQKKATAELMQKKLKNAQKLIEGLALANFGTIADSAEELLQLSKTAEWMVYKTPKYELFNNEFQRATEDLIAKANEKNIDGATLAYFQMTMSCVRCHSYVREMRKGLPSSEMENGAGALTSPLHSMTPQVDHPQPPRIRRIMDRWTASFRKFSSPQGKNNERADSESDFTGTRVLGHPSGNVAERHTN